MKTFAYLKRANYLFFIIALCTVFFSSTAHAATFERYLSVGTSGSDVSALQHILAEKNYFSASATGYYGTVTKRAVAALQKDNDIQATGAVGPLTRAFLNSLADTPATVSSPTTSTGTTASVAITRTLALGATGDDVSALQQFLKDQGFYTYNSITRTFGTVTKAAVVAFQKAQSLEADGRVGPVTRAKILALTTAASTATSTATVSAPTSVAPTNPSLSAPDALKVTQALSYQIGLSWNAVDGATSYTVKRKEYSATDYATTASSITATAYADLTVSPGKNYLYVVSASNGKGESSNSFAVSVIVPAPSGGGGTVFSGGSTDNVAPTISLTAPTDGSSVSGTVTLSANASDNVGVVGVTFKVNGSTIGGEDTVAPYSAQWDTTTTSAGSKTITAVARDAVGNSITSSPVTVTVDNTPPVISAITSSPAATTATVSWTTDKNANSQVEYGTTSSYGSMSALNATLATSHTVSLTGLTAATTYHFRIRTTDGAGNLTLSTPDQTFTTKPAWVLAGATADLDFADSQYYGDTLSNTVSVSRASTAYASNKAGDLVSFGSNVPRITNQGLLIESASTNLMLQSQFGASWGPSAVTITPNSVISPDGTTDAAFVKENSTTAGHNMGPSGTITKAATAGTYTFSIYASRASVGAPRDLSIVLWDGSFANQTNFYANLQTGIMQYGSPSGFTNVGKGCVAASHNYWRCSYTFVAPATAGFNLSIGLVDNHINPTALGGATTYAGDNTSGVYLYGVQMELGASASSYIPTTTAQVTRAADIVTLTGAAQTLLNASAGTASVFTAGGSSTAAATVLDSNGTALLGFNSNNTLTDGVTASLTTANTANRLVSNDRASIAWDGSGRALVLNGGVAIADANTQTPSATLHLGSNGSANFLNGYVSRLALWNTKQASPQANFSLVSGSNYFGVGIAGPDSPNITSFNWPSASDWSYLASKGIKTARLSIAWEDMQPTLLGALNTTYLNFLKAAIASASSNGIGVIVDVHNYGHYVNSTAWGHGINGAGNGGSNAANVYAIGDANLPIADFTDFWTRMATALVGTTGLSGYDIMNEPANLPDTTIWPTAAQNAVTAIRGIDSATPIYVPGDGNFSAGINAIQWTPTILTGTGLIYEAHQYFDFDPATTASGPGTYPSSYSSYNTNEYAGVRSLLAWLGWLKMNNLTGSLGEFNIPNTDTASWSLVQQHVEALLAQQGVSGMMWFYGAQNGGFGSSIQINPISSVDDPRLLQLMGQF